MNISSEGRTLFTVPRPALCQALQYSLATSRALEALGLDPSELVPSPTRGGVDLRPREFACPWAKVRRLGPGQYLRWGRIVASEAQTLAEPSDVGWGSSILICPNFATDQLEQAAGDEVLRQTAVGTGAHGQAMRQWLGLWGWKPPAKGQAAAVPPGPEVATSERPTPAKPQPTGGRLIRGDRCPPPIKGSESPLSEFGPDEVPLG